MHKIILFHFGENKTAPLILRKSVEPFVLTTGYLPNSGCKNPFISLFNIQPGEDNGNGEGDNEWSPQVEEVEHIHRGNRLDSGIFYITCSSHKPSGDCNTNTAAHLNSKGRAGVHGSINSDFLCEKGMLRARTA